MPIHNVDQSLALGRPSGAQERRQIQGALASSFRTALGVSLPRCPSRHARSNVPQSAWPPPLRCPCWARPPRRRPRSSLRRGYRPVPRRPAHVKLTFSRLAKGLNQPVLVTSAPGTHRLFVVERGGLVKIYTSAGVRSTAYLDLTSRANSSGDERGLLGLVFSPHFATTTTCGPATRPAGALQVSRFTASSATASTVSASTELMVINVPHPTQRTTTRGMFAFGPGGNLYISTGDGGGGGDPFGQRPEPEHPHGQDPAASTRTTPAAGKYFCIPARNPYAQGEGARGDLAVSALRNAWRFSVDKYHRRPLDRRRRPGAVEEVTRIPTVGLNLGWSCREGSTVYNASRCTSGSTYSRPDVRLRPRLGRRSSAATSTAARRLPRARRLLRLRRLRDRQPLGRSGAGRPSRRQLGANRLTAFGEDDGGELWAVTFDGGLFQMSRPRAARRERADTAKAEAARAAGLRSADRRSCPPSVSRSPPCPTSASTSTAASVRSPPARRPRTSSTTTGPWSPPGSAASCATWRTCWRDGDAVEPVAIDSADGLAILRHSTAHVMAQAVQELYPDAQARHRPADRERLLLRLRRRDARSPPTTWPRSRSACSEIVKEGRPSRRRVVTDDEARAELAVRAVQARADRAQGRRRRAEAPRRGRRRRADHLRQPRRNGRRASGRTSAAARTCRPPG